MLSRLFPKQFDNDYRGHRLAIWLFVLVMLMRGAQGVVVMITPRDALINADGIPLDSLSAAGADMVVAIFAVTGLYLLMIPLQSLVVLMRYRAMIPFMYLLFLILQLGNRALLMLNPIVRSDSPAMGFAGHAIGLYMNLAILALTLIGFVLSLVDRSASRPASTGRGMT
jgi:hypothetical protein